MSPAGNQTRPPQRQKRQPGSEHAMRPKPDAEARKYRPAGKLKSKVALISGGDSGIGKSVAIHFAKEGADIAIIYLEETRDAVRTRALIEKAGRRCLLLEGDIADRQFCETAVRQAVKSFGRIDILVNNAAEQHTAEDFAEIPPEQFERTFATKHVSPDPGRITSSEKGLGDRKYDLHYGVSRKSNAGRLFLDQGSHSFLYPRIIDATGRERHSGQRCCAGTDLDAPDPGQFSSG